MRSIRSAMIVTVFAMGCSSAEHSTSTDSLGIDDRAAESAGSVSKHTHARVCGGGTFSCFSHVRTDSASGKVQPFAAPSGFGPADLASAYSLDTSVDPAATIAVVDAYGYANAESDLATYRSQYGLPACTVASGCLKIVNQNGATSPLPAAPPSGDDWTVETALDLDMVSAACPKCKIILIQANDDTSDGLFIANQTAVTLGVAAVSNSWGGPEQSGYPSATYEAYFNHPSVGFFFASGDSGYDNGGSGANYPATSQYVTAVGGTSLTKSSATTRGWVETAWSSGGSGCSNTTPKPAWQKNGACGKRAISDVSAVGDPNTGLAVYNKSNGGWIVVGGTSAATPYVTGVMVLTGHAAAGPSFAYANVSSFTDVTSGSDGSCGNADCNAGAGWDGPTGIGTPIGSALAGGKKTCTPACSGKTCGSDGCGGTCGTCPSGESCGSAGTCSSACVPSCSGKTCGSDGCGGTCGTCGAGQTCGTSGTCSTAGSCKHSICTAGKALTGSCDSCASQICAVDSYCCRHAWDSICVGEVASVCGESC